MIAEAPQADLFGPKFTVPVDQVEQSAELAPLTKRWMKRSLGPRLDMIVEGLRWVGAIESANQAPAYLNKLILDSVGDLSNLMVLASSNKLDRLHSNSYRRLKRKMGHEQTMTRNTFGHLLGTYGHSGFLRYLAGQEQPTVAEAEEIGPRQLPLFESSRTRNPSRFVQEAWQGTRLNDQFKARLADCVQAINQAVAGKPWQVAYTQLDGAGAELLDRMFQFAPREITALEAAAAKLPNSTATLLHSLTCWAEAIPTLDQMRDQNKIVSRESALVDKKAGASMGRIDLLAVTGQVADLNLTGESLDEIIRQLTQSGLDIGQGRIVDFKFVDGDGWRGDQTLSRGQVQRRPITRHWNQMTRYLTWAEFDKPGSPFLDGGDLIYIVDGGPVQHTVRPTIEERLELMKQTAFGWTSAQVTAVNRALDSIVVNHILEKREDKTPRLYTKTEPKAAEPAKVAAKQPLFAWQKNPDHPLIQVIDQHRDFIDPKQIFERVRMPDGSVQVIAHGETLYQSDEIGPDGKMFCKFHPDQNKPNMHAYSDACVCFTCKARVAIHWATLPVAEAPENARPRIKIQAVRNPAGDYILDHKAKEKLVEREKLMLLVKEIVQSKFWGTEGERYVWQDRLLNPDLAYQMGAGYGENLAVELINWGIDYDQLIEAGLIGISHKVGTNTPLFKALKEKGMRFEDIRRPHKPYKEKETVWGFPYDPTNGRLIFPLELYGHTVSIYGRKTAESKSRIIHWKNSDKGGVPQGGFNARVFRPESTNTKIALFESALDTVSFQMLREIHPDVWADYGPAGMIGIDNYLMVRQVAESGKVAVTALDNDSAGNQNAAKLQERFKYYGLVGDRREDLVAKFKEVYPFNPMTDDMNKWWQDYGWVIRMRLRR